MTRKKIEEEMRSGLVAATKNIKIKGNTTRAEAQKGGAARRATNTNRAGEKIKGNTTRYAAQQGGAARRSSNQTTKEKSMSDWNSGSNSAENASKRTTSKDQRARENYANRTTKKPSKEQRVRDAYSRRKKAEAARKEYRTTKTNRMQDNAEEYAALNNQKLALSNHPKINDDHIAYLKNEQDKLVKENEQIGSELGYVKDKAGFWRDPQKLSTGGKEDVRTDFIKEETSKRSQVRGMLGNNDLAFRPNVLPSRNADELKAYKKALDSEISALEAALQSSPNDEKLRQQYEMLKKQKENAVPDSTPVYAAKVAGNTLLSGAVGGIGQVNETLAAFTPEIGPLKNVKDWLNENAQKDYAIRDQMQQYNYERSGTVGKVASDLTQSAGAMAPQAILALMSHGGSEAAQLSSKVPALLSMVKNPAFLYSFLQTYGPEYGQAKQNGANEFQAVASALASAAGQSAVEMGGGLEAMQGGGGIRAALKTGLEEGREEVVQDLISGLTSKGIYDQTREWFGMGDSNAIVNPQRMGTEFGAGMFLGTAMNGANQMADSFINRAIKNAGGTVLGVQESVDTNTRNNPTQPVNNAQAAPVQPEMNNPAPNQSAPSADMVRAAIENAGGRVPAELMPTAENTPQAVQETAVQAAETAQEAPRRLTNSMIRAILDDQQRIAQMNAEGANIRGTNAEKRAAIKAWLNRGIDSAVPVQAGDSSGATFSPETVAAAIENAGGRIPPMLVNTPHAVNESSAPASMLGIIKSQTVKPGAEYALRAAGIDPALLGVSPDSSTGAAPSGFDPYTHAANEYGTIPQGEIPARMVDVPVSMDGETRTRQFTRTAMEAKATPDEMIPLFERGVEEGLFSYTPRKNKQDLDSALNYIAQNGYAKSLESWNEKMESGGSVTADDMIRAQIMYAKAAQSGDTATAMKLAGQLAAEGTRLGQAVQSMRMLKRLTPEGKLVYIQRTVDNLNREFGNKLSADQINLNENLVQEYMNAPDDATRSDAEARIYQNIADQVPSTWADKWNAWRYFAMLGNPRTHIRNILGNFMFYVPTKAKDITGAALENLFIQKEKRTKSIGPVSKEISDFVKQDFAEMKDVLIGSDKYNPKQAILQRAKPWSDNNIAGRALNSLTGMNSAALDAEDSVSLGIRYRDALGHYMKARGLKPADMTGHTLEVARNYAVQEAQKATFRDDSPVANALQNLENKNAATKLLVGGLIPFKKTPINIVKRGLEYSPAGFLKTGADAVRMVQQKRGKLESGTMTGTQIIDDLSKAFVGTGLMAAGLALAKSGLLNGADADEKKEQYLNDAAGLQSYSLNIGNYTYTVDWTAPASLPLFMGVELYNAMTGEKDENALNAVLSSLQNITEPVFNLTMLDGINSAIQSLSYGGNPISTAITDTAMDYVGQGVPTLFGQIARTIDDTRRSSNTPDKLTGVDTLDKFLRRQQAKIPVASQKLQPYLDVFGRETKNDSLPMRTLQNLISPGYIAERKDDGVEGHLMRLYDKTGDTDILPGKARSFKVDGEEAQMTGDELTAYTKKAGQGAYYALNDLMNTQTYKNMSDSDRVKAVQDAYSYAKELAKASVDKGYTLSSSASGIKEAVEAGAPVGGILAAKAVQSIAKNNAEDSNTPNPTDVGRRALLSLLQNETSLSNSQKDIIAKTLIINGSDSREKKFESISDTVTATQYAACYAKYQEIDNDKSIDWKNKQQSFLDWLADQPYTNEEKHALAAKIVDTSKYVPGEELDIDFSSKESIYKSQGSASLQKKWGTITGTYGVSIEMAGVLYSACMKGKKEDSVKNVMALTGWSKSRASSFYTFCRRK